MSTCPPLGLTPALLKEATLSWSSIAATAMIEGQFAGWLTGAGGWPRSRRLSLPAAAMIRVPAFIARAAAVSNTAENDWPGRTGAPNDIDTIRHLRLTAHWMPLRMPASAPLPWLLSTLPAKIRAAEATP